MYGVKICIYRWRICVAINIGGRVYLSIIYALNIYSNKGEYITLNVFGDTVYYVLPLLLPIFMNIASFWHIHNTLPDPFGLNNYFV